MIEIETGHDRASWKAFLASTEALRLEMKEHAPEWWRRVMNLVERQEAWLRNNT